ncbi:hypothetical protein [Mucilaginibacter sp.]|uniref:hypothetical protein n=1 Tax=Mucilaginibacter sp. TaxID=1882438 RepID=UPI002D129390|nr:hypothetical protein [Mucilaginibacter sp.]HTI60903.1 hypothetical protein [Mucilaginibacter sp.]
MKKVKDYAIQTSDMDVLKAYYEKGFDQLKELNKRSNVISRFILILIALIFFPNSFDKFKIFDVEISALIIRVLSPTLLSYLIFEWLMMAKRRRDLIFALQEAGYKIYQIRPKKDERTFPNFNPNTLNVLPFSFMLELLSVNTEKRKFKRKLILFTIFSLPAFLIVIIISSFINTFQSYNLCFCFIKPYTVQFIETFSLYACVTVSMLFIIWSIFYYVTEFENKRKLNSSNVESR